MWPCAFHATHAPVSWFPCSPHHRAPGMEAESTFGGSKERPFFLLSIVRTCIFLMQKMRNCMTAVRLFADGCLDVCLQIFVRRLDPKDPGADRGRAVSPRSRAIVVTFDVATCAAFLPVSVARSSLATSSAREELSDLVQGSSEGRNRAYGARSAARVCRSRRSTTTRPSATTSATSRSSTTASR